MVMATTAVSLPASLVGTLAVQLRQSLHFGTTALGVAVALYYLAAASSSVPASWLAERVGGARVLRYALVAAVLLCALLGGASVSWATLAVLLVLAGIVGGAANPAANLVLARRTRPARQGLVFGVKQAAVPLASLLGGVAVPAVALTVGWRWAFGGAALLAALTVAALPAPRRTLAEHRQGRQGGERAAVLSLPLVTLTAGLGLGMLAASGCSTFLVSAGVALGFAKGAAGLVAAGAGAAAVVARVGIGARADHQGGGHLRVVALMLGVGVAGYLALAVGTIDHDQVLFVVGAVVALGAGWGWNGLFNFAVVRSHVYAPAAATGVTQVGGRLGAMVGPLVFGVVASDVSYSVAWLFAGAMAACAVVAVLIGRRLLAAARPGTESPGAARPGAARPGAERA